MMWADNYWIFSDDREKRQCKVNDIIDELMDLDMEPKPESPSWTSTFKTEDEGDRFRRNGKGIQETEKGTLRRNGKLGAGTGTSVARRVYL